MITLAGGVKIMAWLQDDETRQFAEDLVVRTPDFRYGVPHDLISVCWDPRIAAIHGSTSVPDGWRDLYVADMRTHDAIAALGYIPPLVACGAGTYRPPVGDNIIWWGFHEPKGWITIHPNGTCTRSG